MTLEAQTGSTERPPGPSALDRVHQILLDTARQLGSSLDPDAIFVRMLESVRGAMRCDGLIVSSFDREQSLIRCVYACVGGNVIDPATLPPLPFRSDSGGMQSQVIRTGKPTLFCDVQERVRDPKGRYYEVDPTGGVRDLRDAGPPLARSAIMAPLRLEGEVVGVVQVSADTQDAYSRLDLELLEGISLLLAVALENARLFRRVQGELDERRRAEQELRETEEALREADRRKDEFLATLGHELRNPLNPIRSAVELLRRRGEPDRDARWAQDVIQRQIVHLTRLIDDLLDVSRITQGKLELRRSDVTLDEVLEAAVESARPMAEAAGQTLMVQVAGSLMRLHADPIRLAQVFANLLDNASKYSPSGTRIEITIERQEDHVAVQIRDEGRGIRPEHLARVFDLFYQAGRSEGRVHDGLGLGLTLVKRLVEMHGGTVQVTSDGLDRGSRFVVRLPLAESRSHGPASPHGPSGARGPWRFLVADDNRDSVESLAMLLQFEGHEVKMAYDGGEALEIAASGWAQVLLLDIGMPRMNGYQLAERVRSEPWGRDLVLIAATGWGQEEDRRRSLESGFDAHLVKPVDPEGLMQLVSGLASRLAATSNGRNH
ncbi:MAG: hybrid sensor histidine kinase/response regulator [Candidatus Eisenbacteria bacterium]|uniref:histidine kinase n=1 Tax=Eiseniibacteriota bacterium TaxID=2212470 RepID=A0A538TW31_UNCEI|nr:MAG: hybrid sensor histidine kinase/response regulator [Candidatus Eisenbacteria bacterium]